VIDAQSLPVLQELVRRESRSLLQYIHDSFPWTPENEQPALAQLRQFAEEERESAAALGRWLARNRQMVPNLGAYPSGFTTINYASLDYVLPKVAKHEREGLARLDQDLTAIKDAAARALVAALIDKKREHLSAVEKLAAAHPEPSVIRRGA
jgi:hypothetical protein